MRVLRNNVLVLDNAAQSGSAQDCLAFAGSYTYQLVASTAGGQSTSRDQSVLVTEAPPTNPLAGKTYGLTDLNGVPIILESMITVTFNSDGTLNGSGGCNEGFLRDDALLMITFLAPGSDESKTYPYPWQWYDAVVEAKHGDPGSVIALSLSNGKVECPENWDTPCEFAKMFPYHVIGDNDGPYASAFDEATDLVEAACEVFIPQ